jgi:hypothetical protein
MARNGGLDGSGVKDITRALGKIGMGHGQDGRGARECRDLVPVIESLIDQMSSDRAGGAKIITFIVFSIDGFRHINLTLCQLTG